MARDSGLDTLLEMDGNIIVFDNDYWVKIEVRRLRTPTSERPHGIAYSLTLHEPSGDRILGYDNAHGIKPPRRKRFSGRRIEYDHVHRHKRDKGIAYEFSSPGQLVEDFFTAVDEMLEKIQK